MNTVYPDLERRECWSQEENGTGVRGWRGQMSSRKFLVAIALSYV